MPLNISNTLEFLQTCSVATRPSPCVSFGLGQKEKAKMPRSFTVRRSIRRYPDVSKTIGEALISLKVFCVPFLSS